ncbi:MAG TPA: hypothetical protein VF104_00480, partial [Burkholderiales bacterium]
APSLFDDVSWGSADVMEQTRAQLRRLGWNWAELPALWDLDRPRDLERLAAAPDLAGLLSGEAA